MHWTTWKPMSPSYFCMADLRYAIAAVTGMFRYHSRQGLLPSVRRRSGERGGRSRLSTLGRGAGLACRRLPRRSLARVTQIGRPRRQLDIVSWHRVRDHPCPSALSCFNCRINLFLRHTRASAMREGPPMSVGRMGGSKPTRQPARRPSLPCQDASFRVLPAEPVAPRGRKHPRHRCHDYLLGREEAGNHNNAQVKVSR